MPRLPAFTLLPDRLSPRITDPIVAVIARTGVTPNQISLLGFAGNLGAAVLAARGDFLLAGVALLLASALDLLDGALARATGRATAFGAVLDSALDRLSEAAVLGGLTFYFAQRGETEEVVLCFAALAGSFLVSYVRAHALARGVELRGGLFSRAERVIVVGVTLIIGQVRIGLWILAVLAALTGAQRLYLAWEQLPRGGASPPEAQQREKEQSP